MFHISPLFMQFVLCGFLGWIAEIVFTGALDPFKNKRFSLTSTTYIWMFPIYGLMAFFYPPVHNFIGSYSWIARGLVYMGLFFIVEYIAGWILLKATGDYVWKYTSRFNLHGFIQLPHAPAWFAAGLGFERVYPYLIKISYVITS